jgi:hypothetical protein
VHTYTKPQTSSTRSRGLGWRIHGSVEDTKLSTNKQHSLSLGTWCWFCHAEKNTLVREGVGTLTLGTWCWFCHAEKNTLVRKGVGTLTLGTWCWFCHAEKPRSPPCVENTLVRGGVGTLTLGTMGRRPRVWQALGRDGGWMEGKLRAKKFVQCPDGSEKD